jgi:peptidoglycan/xylan/chitin deacetylase (PgdA/CDA1 family)
MPAKLVIPSRMKPTNVPVVMYHSIVDAKDKWPLRHLSCPVAVFESHLKALRRANYETISLQMLYEYMAEGKPIPSRSVVLTFDDGYLDNWVYAYPLLKKYGFKGAIFVTPEFVDPAETVRPNLENVWNKQILMRDLPTTGFLSWAEMREMERTGVIEIQAHGLTHTWYYASAEIIDFHHPGDPYMWLAWNSCPTRKHLWMAEDQQTFTPWGLPVYQHAKSLATRRYFPDENLNETVVDFVKTRGEMSLFDRSDWRQTLQQVVENYRRVHGELGHFESDEEYRARLYHELNESKRIIETNLGKTVNFLCWPGGGYNETSVEISKQVGYLASTLSSRDRGRKNIFGAEPSWWARISPPTAKNGRASLEYQGGFHLVFKLNSERGSNLYRLLFKSLKLTSKLSQGFINLG